VLVMLVSDTTFALLNLLGLYSTGHPIDALILTYNLGWGAVALHPRANDLTAAAPRLTNRPSWPRLVTLSVASLIAPGALIIQVTSHHLQELIVTSASAALLFLLALARMAGLVVQLEKVQGELAYRATHDQLTKLANRREFTDQLARALQQHPGGGVTVLFLDLDRFKSVNDTLGHGAGDTLLTVVADRLRAELRGDDIVARLGGDEFAVLLGAPALDREQLDVVTARLAFAVGLPVRLDDQHVEVGVSIGTAIAAPGQTLEEIVHNADRAMYATKAASATAP
jgi:diguanylate cyclase (GGDEF)-like protein